MDEVTSGKNVLVNFLRLLEGTLIWTIGNSQNISFSEKLYLIIKVLKNLTRRLCDVLILQNPLRAPERKINSVWRKRWG